MSCYSEYKTLQAFYEEIEDQFPSFLESFAAWKERLDGLGATQDFETLSVEQELNTLSLWFRSIWLKRVQHFTSHRLKSPGHFKMAQTMRGEDYQFAYDRWARPKYMEAVHTYQQNEPPTDWQVRHSFFSSAMTAFNSFVLSFRNFSDAAQASILTQKGYFEFRNFFQLLGGKDLHARVCEHREDFHTQIEGGRNNIILIEPVWANRDLTLLDLDGFLSAWQRRPHKKNAVIMVDTSLVGDRFKVTDFLDRLSDHPPGMVVFFRSALKLHQQGLEFSNFGLLSIYVHNEHDHFDALGKVQRILKMTRQLIGSGVSYDNVCALEFSLRTHKRFYESFCDAIFQNNADMAHHFDDFEGLIDTIIHPCLSKEPPTDWTVAPYTIFRLKEGDIEDLRFLKRILHHEAQKNGLALQSGSSFGFRYHRFEINDYQLEDGPSFRLSLGSVSGPSLGGIKSLLEDILRHNTFDSLRESYPQYVIEKEENP